jgi:hypothetical protein
LLTIAHLVKSGPESRSSKEEFFTNLMFLNEGTIYFFLKTQNKEKGKWVGSGTLYIQISNYTFLITHEDKSVTIYTQNSSILDTYKKEIFTILSEIGWLQEVKTGKRVSKLVGLIEFTSEMNRYKDFMGMSFEIMDMTKYGIPVDDFILNIEETLGVIRVTAMYKGRKQTIFKVGLDNLSLRLAEKNHTIREGLPEEILSSYWVSNKPLEPSYIHALMIDKPEIIQNEDLMNWIHWSLHSKMFIEEPRVRTIIDEARVQVNDMTDMLYDLKPFDISEVNLDEFGFDDGDEAVFDINHITFEEEILDQTTEVEKFRYSSIAYGNRLWDEIIKYLRGSNDFTKGIVSDYKFITKDPIVDFFLISYGNNDKPERQSDDKFTFSNKRSRVTTAIIDKRAELKELTRLYLEIGEDIKHKSEDVFKITSTWSSDESRKIITDLHESISTELKTIMNSQ